jgi:hypothetical protein
LWEQVRRQQQDIKNINQEAQEYLYKTPENKPINIQQAATQDIPQPRTRTD